MPPLPPILGIPGAVTEALATMGIELEPGDAERLRAYLEALRAANARFNLTAIVEPETMWVRHIQDCLTLVPFLASAEAKTVIDIGSGGGLPGIPLAIVMPEVQFTLLEATGKKAAFIKETIAALGISNARILNDRAETAGQDHHDHRAKYDAVVARAVGKLNVLVELTVPFAREAGSIFLIKGDKAAEEVEEAKPALYKLHTHVVDLHKTATGTVVVLEKTRATPRNYPRLPGEPKRRPLG
ncbi:MAG: 16S rRNA (guanine(527)-N(7))-methyltransferase RsmG [Planctomycetaceae bacterium]|nr:MAG: 16S rRNA (guanine(527)-N(7))-methyltransferase RsmG [Planctomycetaceae bacterium]